MAAQPYQHWSPRAVEEGEDAGGPPPPTGGTPGGHGPGEAGQPAPSKPAEKHTPWLVFGAVLLILLGVYLAATLFNWGGPPPQGVEKEPSGLDLAHVLSLLASLFSVGYGVSLLVNGPPPPPADTKKRQAGDQVPIVMMVLGGLLGVTMLGHPPTALLIPAVITSFVLFTFGLLNLQQQRKKN